MTTLASIHLGYPICGRTFSSTIVVSTNAHGGRQSDFHECATGRQPLPYMIHRCGPCGFAGAASDFGDTIGVSPTLRQRVWSELAPKRGRGVITGSENYEAAARVAEWQWFDRVADEIEDPITQQWLAETARRQRDDPREWLG